jgi:uncharacterized damage-inducible protein DinB
MHVTFVNYMERLQRLHADVEGAIAGLPQEALDWVPGSEMNSIAVLVVHLTGAERYWIGDVVGREPSGRDRAAEFRVQGLDEAALKRRLDETLAYCRGIVEKLTLQDLEAIRTSPRDGQQFTVAWSLLHTLEHTAIHLGHIQIVRQLWDQRR